METCLVFYNAVLNQHLVQQKGMVEGGWEMHWNPATTPYGLTFRCSVTFRELAVTSWRGGGRGREKREKHTQQWGRNRSLKMLEWRKRNEMKEMKKKRKKSRQLYDMQVWRGRRQDARWWQWWGAWPLIPDGAMERSVRVEEEENTTRLFQKQKQKQPTMLSIGPTTWEAKLLVTTNNHVHVQRFVFCFRANDIHHLAPGHGRCRNTHHTHTRENTQKVLLGDQWGCFPFLIWVYYMCVCVVNCKLCFVVVFFSQDQ